MGPSNFRAFIYEGRFLFYIGDLTLGTGFHGKPFFFALLQKYPFFNGSLERSDRAESGISRTFEKKYFLVKL